MAKEDGTQDHPVVTREAWLSARVALLTLEKEFTRLRDQLSRKRRELPWVKVEKSYTFEGPQGKRTLAELFENRRQLIVYHFMFDPEWTEGCKHCSFWADHFDGTTIHLKHRDVTLAVVSRAPLASIEAFKKRMGWRFPWFSSLGSDFNHDYHVSFTPGEIQSGAAIYNYSKEGPGMAEREGVSVFFKDDRGAVHHTYSCYARGIDMLNATYQFLDLAPLGRDEEGLQSTQAWVQHHDRYQD